MAGHDVTVVDNLSNSKQESLHRVQEWPAGAGFQQVDLLDRAGLDTVFAGAPIDAVIHFAGLKAVGESVGSRCGTTTTTSSARSCCAR